MRPFFFGRKRGLLALMSLGAIALVGCGGSSTTGSASGSSSKKVLSLNIGVGSASTNYGAYWIAEAEQLFAKNGLDIHVVSYNTSGTTANVVASGRVQLQLFTAPLGLQLAEHGMPISIVYELSSFSASGMSVIGAKGITSVSQLRSAPNCRIATTAVGTVPYAFAVRYVKVEGLSNCTLVTSSTVAPLMASVSSGNAQAGIVTYANTLGAVGSGSVTLLLDPLKIPADLAKRLVPVQYPAFVVFGLRSTVRENKGAVVRFVRTLRQANAALLKLSPDQLGAKTAPLQGMAGAPASLLSKSWLGTMSQIPTGGQAGYISKDAWGQALKGFSDWSLPGYNASDSALSYKQVVDMSYFQQAAPPSK